MDDAERIPIDIGYGAASPAEAAVQPLDRRTTVREDGTLVIDILASQPCEPQPSTGGEIVVCAQTPAEGEARAGTPPPSASATEKIGEALKIKVGPIELGSIEQGAGTRAFGAWVRF